MSDDRQPPRPLDALLDDAAKRLIARSRSQPTIPLDANQGMLLTGPWQEAYPGWMGMEPILDVFERAVYGYLWIFGKSGGRSGVSFPSYEDIQRGTHIGARATVARALIVLRLTRWVTLCRRVRDDLGRNQGNIYCLNDEPAPLPAVFDLDPEYMQFLESCLSKHADLRVRAVAALVHHSIRDSLEGDGAILDPSVTAQTNRRSAAERALAGLGEDYFGSRLSRFEDKRRTGIHDQAGDPPEITGPTSDLSVVNNTDNVGDIDRVHVVNSASIEQESRVQQRNSVSDGPEVRVHVVNSVPQDRVQQMNSESFSGILQSSADELINNNSSCCSSFIKTTTTTTPFTNEGNTRASVAESKSQPVLAFPDGIDENDQRLIELELKQIPEDLHQVILDELAGVIRMRKNTHDPIRSPSRYFHTIAKLAKAGRWQPSALAKDEFQRRKQAQWLAQQRALSEAKAIPAEVETKD